MSLIQNNDESLQEYNNNLKYIELINFYDTEKVYINPIYYMKFKYY